MSSDWLKMSVEKFNDGPQKTMFSVSIQSLQGSQEDSTCEVIYEEKFVVPYPQNVLFPGCKRLLELRKEKKRRRHKHKSKSMAVLHIMVKQESEKIHVARISVQQS